MPGSGIVFYGFCATQLLMNPGAISGNTASELTFTLPGLLTSDVVISVVKPTLTAGLDIGNTRVSATNTVAITFQNSTASPIDPPAENYTFVIFRPEKTLGGPDALTGGNVIFN